MIVGFYIFGAIARILPEYLPLPDCRKALQIFQALPNQDPDETVQTYTSDSTSAFACHIPCQGVDSAASQWPSLATRHQNEAVSVPGDACASRDPSAQFSTTQPDPLLSTPALAVSYRSTPVFMMVHIILRSNFPESAYLTKNPS